MAWYEVQESVDYGHRGANGFLDFRFLRYKNVISIQAGGALRVSDPLEHNSRTYCNEAVAQIQRAIPLFPCHFCWSELRLCSRGRI